MIDDPRHVRPGDLVEVRRLTELYDLADRHRHRDYVLLRGTAVGVLLSGWGTSSSVGVSGLIFIGGRLFWIDTAYARRIA